MNIIICIENSGGMLFNRRRVSRDKAVVEDIVSYTDGAMLRMNEYSSVLFADCGRYYAVDEDFLEKAAPGDYCFVENTAFDGFIGEIEKIIVYNWNRDYPSDLKFDISVLEGFALEDEREFTGNSHDCITRRVYGRQAE